jgi:hypothetical protein
MGGFADSPKWKLVNAFTIYEDKNLSDRPFMRTCVPKRLDVEVTAFEIVSLIEWPSSYGQEVRPDGYADGSFLKFSGKLDDKIIVFSMAKGEIATFRALTDATIRALPRGQIGGKNKAIFSDGTACSGMSSHDVPERGLMDGEPGSLSFISEYEERLGEKSPAILTASLYLDEDKFSRVLQVLSLNTGPVRRFKLSLLVELFESEVSASFSKPWMSRDYGFLVISELADTRARIDSLIFSTGGLINLKPNSEGEGNDASTIERDVGIARRTTNEAAPELNQVLLKYQRYILLALLVLIGVTLLSR